jgi:hypothetical protein
MFRIFHLPCFKPDVLPGRESAETVTLEILAFDMEKPITPICEA